MKVSKLHNFPEGKFFLWKHAVDSNTRQPVKFYQFGRIFRVFETGVDDFDAPSSLELISEYDTEVVECNVNGNIV